MTNSHYGLFCPLAMACEILEPRWTILILGEMSGGASRFNEIRRGVPGISPTLLSRRLREMEAHGLVERLEDTAKGTVDYVRTSKAKELQPALRMLAEWAYKHVESEVALEDLTQTISCGTFAGNWMHPNSPNAELSSGFILLMSTGKERRTGLSRDLGTSWNCA